MSTRMMGSYIQIDPSSNLRQDLSGIRRSLNNKVQKGHTEDGNGN